MKRLLVLLVVLGSMYFVPFVAEAAPTSDDLFLISARELSGCQVNLKTLTYDCSSRITVPLGTFLKKVGQRRDVFFVEDFEGNEIALGWWGWGLSRLPVFIKSVYDTSVGKNIPLIVKRGSNSQSVVIETTDGTLVGTQQINQEVTYQVENDEGEPRYVALYLIRVSDIEAIYQLNVTW